MKSIMKKLLFCLLAFGHVGKRPCHAEGNAVRVADSQTSGQDPAITIFLGLNAVFNPKMGGEIGKMIG